MRPLLLAFLLAGVLPGAAAGVPEREGEDVWSQLTGSVEGAVRSAEPFLFRVIRTRPAAAEAGRVLGAGVSLGGGRILTTAGVVGPATEVLIVRANGDTLEARVRGVDRRTDLALLEVDGFDYPPIPMSESSIPFPGSPVVALGLGPRPGIEASFGVIVLADGPRLGLTETDVLQVSAPPFPGMTGGPLVNLDGELVGLVSGRIAFDPSQALLPPGKPLAAGFVRDGQLTTVSPTSAIVALPAGLAQTVARELEEHGLVERGYLGLQVELVETRRKDSRNMPGVLVQRVVSGSPAEDGGLLPGDVILEYANAKVRSPENLSYLVAATLPGSRVPIVLLRRGVRTHAEVEIAQAAEPPWNPALDESVPGTAAAAGVAPAAR